jgi:hypothetical protein
MERSPVAGLIDEANNLALPHSGVRSVKPKVRIASLALGIPIWVLLNIAGFTFASYFPPIWNENSRVRPLRIGKANFPIALIVTPVWIATALAKTWKKSGALMALGPIVLTVSALSLLVAGTLTLHHVRESENSTE